MKTITWLNLFTIGDREINLRKIILPFGVNNYIHHMKQETKCRGTLASLLVLVDRIPISSRHLYEKNHPSKTLIMKYMYREFSWNYSA